MRALTVEFNQKGRLSRVVVNVRKGFASYRAFGVALSVVAVVVAVAVSAPILASHDPVRVNPLERLQPPGNGHVLGTDALGRDVYSRVVYGARTSLLVGAAVAGLTLLLSVVMGSIAGYFRRADLVLMRVIDAVMSFPGIVLAIALVAERGAGLATVVIAITAVFVGPVTRVVRSVVLDIRERPFIEAARAIGVPPYLIVVRHVLPNVWPPVLVQISFAFAQAVILEATLSFLGVGPPPRFPSWGNMIAEGKDYLRIAPWIVWPPAIALAATVLALNMVGDGLRDLLDPRMRRAVGRR